MACLNTGTANNQNRIAEKNPLAFSAVMETYIRKARLFGTTEIIILNLSGLLAVTTDCVTNSVVRQIW